MKKSLPYLVVIAVVVLLSFLILGKRGTHTRYFNESVTLKQRDKIPYGTAVAKGLLPQLFPGAAVYYDHEMPGSWDSVHITDRNQAVILIAKDFNADEQELSRIKRFVANGNYVFLVTRYFSYEALSYLGMSQDLTKTGYPGSEADSLLLNLSSRYFGTDTTYAYPGLKYENNISTFRNNERAVLGTDNSGQPDFIVMKKDSGRLFVHTAPLAFSNYFILYKNNRRYFEQALSVIPQGVTKVLWNDYYLTKTGAGSNPPEPNWLRGLLRYPPFLTAFLLLLFLLLLYILLHMRRAERMVSPHIKPANESLDFVKTVGRLYYERKDHGNLAQKMGAHFLEYIRSNYKLPTHTLDEAFTQSLHYKSGYDAVALQKLIYFTAFAAKGSAVTEDQLKDYYTGLELFYKNT